MSCKSVCNSSGDKSLPWLLDRCILHSKKTILTTKKLTFIITATLLQWWNILFTLKIKKVKCT